MARSPKGERLVVAEREQRAMAPDNAVDAAARPRAERERRAVIALLVSSSPEFTVAPALVPTHLTE